MIPNQQDDLSAGYLAQRNVTDADVEAREVASAQRTDLAQADVAITAERMTKVETAQPVSAGPAPEPGAETPPKAGSPGSGLDDQPTGSFSPAPGGIVGPEQVKATAEFINSLPRNVAIGGLKAANNINAFVHDSMASLASTFLDEPVSGATMQAFVDALFDEVSPEFAINTKEILKQAESDGGSDLLTQSMAEFLIPFSAYTRLNAAMGLTGTLGKQAANAVVADAETAITALDPHMERFAGMIQQLEVTGEVPILGPFIDYLADTSEESDAEGRFKNALDSAGANASIVGALFGAGKLIKFAREIPAALRRTAPDEITIPPVKPGESFKAETMSIADLMKVPGDAPRKSPQELVEFTKKIQSGEIKPTIIVETKDGKPVRIKEGNHTLRVLEGLGNKDVEVRIQETGAGS